MSKTFCIAPWHDVHIQTDGTFKGCCVMSNGPQRGLFKKDNEYVTVRDGLSEGVNSDTAKELRLASLNNEWHPECVRCMNEEKSGMQSMRMLYDKRWGNKFDIEEAKKITDPVTGKVDDDHVPFFYDIQLGNLCNLKCRICHPFVSSAWIPDYIKLMGYPENEFRAPTPSVGTIHVKHISGKQYDISPNPFAWANSDEFWEQMSKRKSKIDHLYLIGGEPMMIQRHFKFLQECVDSGDSNHITLQYDTNLTNIPEKILQLWTKFKRVEIGFSIDGMGPELEYQRNPIKWSHMLKNINRIEKLAVENDNIKIFDSITINIYNVLHILDYIEWKLHRGRDTYEKLWQHHSNNMGAHPLHGPDYLCIKTIPKNAKIKIEEYWYKWLDKMLAWVDSLEDDYSVTLSNVKLKENLSSFVNSWVSFMNQDDWSKNMYRFWEFTNDLDKIRDEKFSDVFPELSVLLDKHLERPNWWAVPTDNFENEL